MALVCHNSDLLLPSAGWFSVGSEDSKKWTYSHCGSTRCPGSMFELEFSTIWILTEWPAKGREMSTWFPTAWEVIEHVATRSGRHCLCSDSEVA